MKKFKEVFMRGRGAHKNTEHGVSWLNGVLDAVRNGTPAALKRIAISYHGQPPHIQNDLSEPILARPSAEPVHPVDLPNVQGDQLRTVDATPLPKTFGMRDRSHDGGTVPNKLGQTTTRQLMRNFRNSG